MADWIVAIETNAILKDYLAFEKKVYLPVSVVVYRSNEFLRLKLNAKPPEDFYNTCIRSSVILCAIYLLK